MDNRYYGKIRKNVENIVNNYNIDLEIYNSLFTKQSGCCAICGKHQSDLPTGLVIDHDHKTNKVRGLLCNSCNSFLGQIKDNIAIAKEKLILLNYRTFIYKQMIEYLKAHPSILSDDDAKEIYKIRTKRANKTRSKNTSAT